MHNYISGTVGNHYWGLQANERWNLVVCSIRRSSAFLYLLRLGLILGLTLLSWNTHLTVPAQAEEEGSRFCQGFLYCKETKGNTTATQACLYLYSTEERGTYSRLTVIPFCSRELDPERNYLRRSCALASRDIRNQGRYLLRSDPSILLACC